MIAIMVSLGSLAHPFLSCFLLLQLALVMMVIALSTQEGWGNLSLRVTESRVFAALLFGGALISLAQVALAPSAQWVEFGKLFDESRLVHVSTLDLTVLTLCAPFWMFNDAAQREWEPRCVTSLFRKANRGCSVLITESTG